MWSLRKLGAPRQHPHFVTTPCAHAIKAFEDKEPFRYQLARELSDADLASAPDHYRPGLIAARNVAGPCPYVWFLPEEGRPR